MTVGDGGEGPAFYRPSDIAQRWGVSHGMVLARIHSRELPAFRIGPRSYRVPADKLAEYEAARTSKLKTPEEREADDARERQRTVVLAALKMGAKHRAAHCLTRPEVP